MSSRVTPGLRQFAVKHCATGLITLVNHSVNSNGGYDATTVAHKAGLRWPANCDVTIVPLHDETPLPFDDIPLALRPRCRSA